MPDDRDPDIFLEAEQRATAAAEALEELAGAMQGYQATADALNSAAVTLAKLGRTHRRAALAIASAATELRRLGVEDTQHRLDELAATLQQATDAASAGVAP